MPTTMQAVRWTPDLALELSELPVVEPGPDQVQIEVESVGICGSDLHFFLGEWPARAGLVPGHEFGGTVSAVGRNVDHVREGDIVGVEPLLRCGRCRYCVGGLYHLCRERALIGEGADGGMARFATVPGYTVHRTPAAVDSELAALAEPLACSVHGYARVGLRGHETVLIVGAGSIGLTALLAAKANGARVLVQARHPQQQEAARSLGADEVLGDDEAGRSRLAELAGDWAIDLAVETVGGQSDTLLQAQRAVRPYGRVLVLGGFSVPTTAIDTRQTVIKEVSVVGSVCYAAPDGRPEYDIALEMLASQGAQARSLITHRLALDAVHDAFATALDKSSGSIKVHMNPPA